MKSSRGVSAVGVPIVLAGLVVATAFPVVRPAGAVPAPPPAVPDSVLVVHVDGGTDTVRAAAAAADADRHAGVRLRHASLSQGTFSVQVPAGNVAAAARTLAALPSVTAVEPGVVRTFDGTPDDPSLAREKIYLDAVHAPTAWAHQHGSAAVRIAVVDSGVDVGHPDLRGKIAATHNAVTGTTDVTDVVGHGTFVAGVAAANTNNRVGIAGAGYDTELLAVKIAGPDGTIAIDDEVAGIRWAADHGADVVNLSLGGPDPSSAERAAVAYAQRMGVLVVAAAGNDGETLEQYPAHYPGVLAVGATDPARGARASFSNHGGWVDVAAPGVHIWSVVPRAGSTFWPRTTYPGGYANGDGTSFSTPLVAAEAALIKAQNPVTGPAGLRAAVLASAHGYGGRGLGHGQVDYARGLAHVAPPTTPRDVHAEGTTATVQLVASSTAARAAFDVGSARVGEPVPVRAGRAVVSFPSWGRANGTHTLRAVDCSAYGECNPTGASARFVIDNPASTITSPTAGATVTGRFIVHARNPAGGPLQLLVGGHVRASVAHAPYDFALSATAFSDGSHALRTRACTPDGQFCQGPQSAPVTVTTAALHPAIRSLWPARFSPNADHHRDATTLSFKLPDRETVHVEVIDQTGTVVRRRSFGTVPAGRHAWTWSGTTSSGMPAADGAYTIVLETGAGARRGWISRGVGVDTRVPALGRPRGSATSFNPYPDGYRDRFTASTTLGEAGTLALSIYGPRGRWVQTLRAARSRGSAALTWNGRNRSGARVARGRYRWRLVVTDAAGNQRRSGAYPVTVSGRRLVTRTVDLTKRATSYVDAGGTARCATARTRASAFVHGLRLTNACPAGEFESAYVGYGFVLPAAHSYLTLTLRVRGRSNDRPSELSAAFVSTDGAFEIPRYVTVSRAGIAWRTIATVPAAGHVTTSRRVHVTVVLGGTYRGVNDFDIATARLRARLVVLR